MLMQFQGCNNVFHPMHRQKQKIKLPSTTIACFFALMVSLCGCSPNKRRLLSKIMVSGEFIYFGIPSPIIRPPNAATLPLISPAKEKGYGSESGHNSSPCYSVRQPCLFQGLMCVFCSKCAQKNPQPAAPGCGAKPRRYWVIASDGTCRCCKYCRAGNPKRPSCKVSL